MRATLLIEHPTHAIELEITLVWANHQVDAVLTSCSERLLSIVAIDQQVVTWYGRMRDRRRWNELTTSCN
ncbi:MAG: hypothetical protein ABS56_17625 [Lautropia sp. SCN 69-89]|nr:MAG: hypothetical protein ABS56_17625 [Lautropia sp. SCN 69-89]